MKQSAITKPAEKGETMSEMIERVRYAICNVPQEPNPTYSDFARAAIEAMREPTDEMLKAIRDKVHEIGGEPDKMWRTMIDAALG